MTAYLVKFLGRNTLLKIQICRRSPLFNFKAVAQELNAHGKSLFLISRAWMTKSEIVLHRLPNKYFDTQNNY